MQKLALAEDTSNIDRSSDGLRELKKKEKTCESEKDNIIIFRRRFIFK